MPTYRYKVVDVFTDKPLLGNPVAVVLNAAGMDADTMQQVARWTNLSETTFVLPPTAPGADYQLRIFTPGGELPFAGHPTIGSAHAVLEAEVAALHDGTLLQECLAGVLRLTAEDDGAGGRRLFVRVPPANVTAAEVPADVLGATLRTPIAASPGPLPVDVGPVWLIAQAESPAALAAAQPDMAALATLSTDLGLTGVTVFALDSAGPAALHVRSFCPAVGVPEDPVCGSGNAAVAEYLRRTGLLPHTGERYLAHQGEQLQRAGRVHVRVQTQAQGEIWIGGHAVTVVDGTLTL